MSKTKIFFDTEFTGLHQNTTMISIGLVSECGQSFYAELTDYDKTQVDDWVQKNVIDNLCLSKEPISIWDEDSEMLLDNGVKHRSIKTDTANLKIYLSDWLSNFRINGVEMWSDCLSYDWVLFNQIFGHDFNIPKNVYYIPFDICTLFYAKGIDSDINREAFSEMSEGVLKHNALWDAKVIRQCFAKLQGVALK